MNDGRIAARSALLAPRDALMKTIPKLAHGDRRRNAGLRRRFCDTETRPRATHAPCSRVFRAKPRSRLKQGLAGVSATFRRLRRRRVEFEPRFAIPPREDGGGVASEAPNLGLTVGTELHDSNHIIPTSLPSRDSPNVSGIRPDHSLIGWPANEPQHYPEKTGILVRTERHCCGSGEGHWPSSDSAPPASSPLRGFGGDGAWCRRN